MGFSDEDRSSIFLNVYVLKVMEPKILTNEFPTCYSHCLKPKQYCFFCVLLLSYFDFLALKAYRISLVFLFCNIHTQTGYYKKGICSLLQIFSAAILPNIIKICQHLTE